MPIPRVIHQVYFNAEESLPPEIVKNINYLKSNNKNWEYRLYSEKNILFFLNKNYGGKILDSIKTINPKYKIVISDLFKYMLMYKEGGLYLDIKSSIKRPIDEIIQSDDTYLLSQWKNQPGSKFAGWGIHEELSKLPGGEFQQWFMLAEAKHPFLSSVIKKVLYNMNHYDVNFHGVGRRGVLNLSGPIAYSLAIMPLLKTIKHRIFCAEDEGFIYSIFPDNKLHRMLFKNQYASLKEKIILRKSWLGRLN